MTRLISIFSVLILTSCYSKYNRNEVTKYFEEIKELNQILIDQIDQLEWKNDPMTISTEITQTKDLIEFLKTELNLTEIEFHDKIDGKENHVGLAYRFGNPNTEKNYSFLIFTKNQDDLKVFNHYEQFVDCGRSENINSHWAFSRIIVDCNN